MNQHLKNEPPPGCAPAGVLCFKAAARGGL